MAEPQRARYEFVHVIVLMTAENVLLRELLSFVLGAQKVLAPRCQLR